jgi:hypothetical protein
MEASTGSDRENDHDIPAYGGWVYHMGTHSLGYQYFHARYLVIRGKYVTMFKRDPVEHPRAVPITRGVVSHHLMVEDVGRKMYHGRVGETYHPGEANSLSDIRCIFGESCL